MEQLTSVIDQTWAQAQEHKYLTLGLATVGGLYLSGKVLCKLFNIFKYTLRPGYDLKQRYGDNWAVVTGASDGIGKEYAIQLAKKGFKIGLIARNEEKLNTVADEIKKLYGVDTKIIVFDFDDFYTKTKLEELYQKLRVFDKVSILVNNVGVGLTGNFNEFPEDKINSSINVNVVGLTFITKLLLPKMLKNDKRGGIINIGSGTTEFVYTGMSVYSSTKSYVTWFSQ
jgi:short-subunit dehydrogenase